jgi:hypothetical protein
MKKELKIDKAIYLVDETTKSYKFLKRNKNWKSLDPNENELNKKYIHGYIRVFRNGQTKRYKYK